MPDELPIVFFANAQEWEAWLEDHHATSPGVRIKIARKGSDRPSVRYPEVLDIALCFGWIDGRRNAHDDEHFLQRFTPRRARSRWSRINRDKATELMAAGRMRPAGLEEVERAKADGRWDSAYEGSAKATVPDDLAAALAASDRAREEFERLDGRNRYAILYRVQDAKRPETRERRIAKFVAMLEAGERIYP